MRMNEMPTFWNRKEARNAMLDADATKYRVRDNCVDFYGVMPNSNTRGWYLAGYCAF